MMRVDTSRNSRSDWDVLVDLWVEEYMKAFNAQSDSTNYRERKRLASKSAGLDVPDVKIALGESAKRIRREEFDEKLARVGQKAIVALSKILKPPDGESEPENETCGVSGKFSATDEIRNWFLHNDALAISPAFLGEISSVSFSGWSGIWSNSNTRKLYREGFRFEVDTPRTGCHIVRLIQRPTPEPKPEVVNITTPDVPAPTSAIDDDVKALLRALLAKLG